MRARSKKIEAAYRLRRPLVEALLDRYPWCCRCYLSRSTDVHEVQPRGRGGHITCEQCVVAICRQCHDHIHAHPAESDRDGWLVSSGMPHDEVRVVVARLRNDYVA